MFLSVSSHVLTCFTIVAYQESIEFSVGICQRKRDVGRQ